MPHTNTYRKDEHVSCKYYRKESSTEIKCLGLCGSHTCNVFPTKAEKMEWKADFCNELYWNCPLYIALDIDNGEIV
jgi:hypothetical protein